MQPRAIIFDIDGTLVDSNDAHAAAWMRALAEAGYPAPFVQVRPLIGKGSDKLLPEVAGVAADSPEGEAIGRECRRIFMTDFLPQLQATRGARELVWHLSSLGVTLLVATSADSSEVNALLRVAGADALMDAVTSSDDAERSKPDPDIVHAALSRTRVAREDTVMIGDTPYDIEAAHRAGVKIVALRCGGWWDDAQLKGADAIADAPADLLVRTFRWP